MNHDKPIPLPDHTIELRLSSRSELIVRSPQGRELERITVTDPAVAQAIADRWAMVDDLLDGDRQQTAEKP